MGNNCLFNIGLAASDLTETTSRKEFYESLKILNIKASIAGIALYKENSFIKFVQDTFVKLYDAGRIVSVDSDFRLKAPTNEELEAICQKFPAKSSTFINDFRSL